MHGLDTFPIFLACLAVLGAIVFWGLQILRFLWIALAILIGAIIYITIATICLLLQLELPFPHE